MLANIFDPVQKCCANWPTRSNMYQHSPTFANKVNKPSQHVVPTMLAQCWPTCCDGLNRPLLMFKILVNNIDYIYLTYRIESHISSLYKRTLKMVLIVYVRKINRQNRKFDHTKDIFDYTEWIILHSYHKRTIYNRVQKLWRQL